MSARLATLVLLTAAFGGVSCRQRTPVSTVADVPDITPSRFQNITASSTYVGVEACVSCHHEQHDSWMETAHRRALETVDPKQEPLPGQFSDDLSGRSYRIVTARNELRHREAVQTATGDELVLTELPMAYAIGSGRFSRSYLARRDGFLVESPATWYAALNEWRISPGYEKYNPGFERPINRECIGCHVGRAEPDRGSVQRFSIHAQSIDCERCHGPGSLHVEARTNLANGATIAEPDLTIANPARMTRAEREDVCAQCHLHSAATVDLRGRRRSDFRPGQKLADFCTHYALETPQREMRVVGHMEQMRMSACYRGSDSLTCTTCHDPHRPTPADEAVAFFRSKCLECHTEAACGVPRETRLQSHADDNCVACHMPTSKTDIPHFAFTHHRIGIHAPDAAVEPDRNSLLLPMENVEHLSQIDRDRGAGLAYLQAAGTRESPEAVANFQQRALTLLQGVRERGLVDPEVDAALARLLWGVDQDRTIEMAQSVLAQPAASPEARVTALFTLGTSLLDRQDYAEALPLLEELVTLRLTSEDWYLLSNCRKELGDLGGALMAADRATEISPQYPQLLRHMADLLDATGSMGAAAAARRRADQLADSSLQQTPPGNKSGPAWER